MKHTVGWRYNAYMKACVSQRDRKIPDDITHSTDLATGKCTILCGYQPDSFHFSAYGASFD